MFILHVTGDDYAAMTFEQEYDAEDIFQHMQQQMEDRLVFDTEDAYIEVRLLEFKDVDPAFITFVKHTIMDYDASKHENFYIVGEVQ